MHQNPAEVYVDKRNGSRSLGGTLFGQVCGGEVRLGFWGGGEGGLWEGREVRL